MKSNEATVSETNKLQTLPQGGATAPALHGRGSGPVKPGREDKALGKGALAIRLEPDYAQISCNRGVAQIEFRRRNEALVSSGHAIKLEPDTAQAHNNRGEALERLGRLDEALTCYEHAIELDPDFVPGHTNRGDLLLDLGRPEDALASSERAIMLRPDHAYAHFLRGMALRKLERPDEALASYDHTIRLMPDFAEAYNNRGMILANTERFDEALENYDHAIRLDPDFALAYSNRGITLRKLKRLDEAQRSYEHAIRLQPDYAPAHYFLALCHLLAGDFARGWKGYEWRWKEGQSEKDRRSFTQPLWLGEESLKGKTILLSDEQGLGDTLQFCRYAKMVKELGAHVILEVPKPLVGLVQTLDGPDRLVVRHEGSLPSFDCYCPIMSLPLAFKTDLRTIPSPGRYISSHPDRIGAWRKRLGRKDRPRIGLAWSGSAPRHRSVPLAVMRSLLCPEFEWFSLHRDVLESDVEALDSSPDLHHFGDRMDFDETAALVEHMDLVISIDTSIAHLAGAMGKPVWVLLPFFSEWRWLLDREDSPWYPRARLFRQDEAGEWGAVMENVNSALKTWLETEAGNG
jgi:tetratricopeptide (TPR) repeat protein